MGPAAAQDDGDETNGGRPVRMCALTRNRRADHELLRFVLDPDKRVTPDIRRKLPGRGVWLTATQETVKAAMRKGAFARGFKQQAAADPDLPGLVEALLRKAALQSLAMTNKAGQAVSGFAKIESLLASGDTLALIHAAGAGEDGCAKLDRKFKAIAAAAGRPAPVIRSFTASDLSVALGRENVIHAAVRKSAVSDKFLTQAQRWLVYSGVASLSEPEGDPDPRCIEPG